jgi:micrococcal nuclease
MRLLDRLQLPGLFIIAVLVTGCAGEVLAPSPQDPSPPTPAGPVAAPAIEISGDISGCSTAICCSDCPDLDVDRIIDGDTFASARTRIRLFGVDTPERDEECFNRATDRFREIAGDIVLVEPGPRTEDRYGRKLFYIYTEGGESIDEILIREGLATAWKGDGQHRDKLMSAEEEARRQRRGCLWQPVN